MTGQLAPGMVFAGFTIEQVIGAGGMGTVYVAAHPRLPRKVALKLLHPDLTRDDYVRSRFESEAEHATRLEHPNIVAVHDRGREGDQLWISMQYVTGTDAKEAVEQFGPFSSARAVHIVSEIAQALDYAHGAGVLHRDVKPANILLENDNPHRPGRVLLADFGIAKALAETEQMTKSGMLVASLRYTAPEQFEGAEVDARADVYSLGCTLFHLLTGQQPYPGTSLAQLMHGHLTMPIPKASQVRPKVGTGLDEVIATALAKNREDRYPSCGELAAGARKALSSGASVAKQTFSAPPPPPVRQPEWKAPAIVFPPPPPRPTLEPILEPEPPPAPPSRRGKRGRTIMIGAAVALLVLGGLTGAWYVTRDSDSRDATETTGASVPATFAVTADIPVDFQPNNMAVDPDTRTAYVTHNDTVSVIDTKTNAVTTTISLGQYPLGIAVDPGTRTAFVTHSGGSVSVIDTKTNTVTKTISVAGDLNAIAVDPGTHTAYIATMYPGSVSMIDTTTNAVTKTIPVAGELNAIAVDSATHTAYVTHRDSDTVSAIDTTSNTVIATITVSSMPVWIAVDPGAHAAYVTHLRSDAVTVIDTITNTVTTSIGTVGRGTNGVAVDPRTHTAYLTHINTDNVTVIDTNTNSVITTIPVGRRPVDIAVDGDTHTAFVVNYDSASVSVITRSTA